MNIMEKDPTRRMRQLTTVNGVSSRTIRRAVRDLGLVSYVRRRCQLLSEATKAKRVEQDSKLLTWMRRARTDRLSQRIFFSDKMWTADKARNRQNDSYLASWSTRCHQSMCRIIPPQP